MNTKDNPAATNSKTRMYSVGRVTGEKKHLLRMDRDSAISLAFSSVKLGRLGEQFGELLESYDAAAQELFLKSCAAMIKYSMAVLPATIGSDESEDAWRLCDFDFERVGMQIACSIMAAHNSGNYTTLVREGMRLAATAQKMYEMLRARDLEFEMNDVMKPKNA